VFIFGRSFTLRGRAQGNFAASLIRLIGHLGGTALIFLVFIALTWVISYSVNTLNAAQKFPQEVFDVISRVEMWLIYIDITLCSVVLILGTVRFCIDLLENRYE